MSRRHQYSRAEMEKQAAAAYATMTGWYDKSIAEGHRHYAEDVQRFGGDPVKMVRSFANARMMSTDLERRNRARWEHLAPFLKDGRAGGMVGTRDTRSGRWMFT